MNYIIRNSPGKILVMLMFALSHSAFSQVKEISRNWTSVTQFVDASFVKTKTKFRISASVKVETTDSLAWAGVWARVDTKNGGRGFFDNMHDRPIRSNQWTTYIVDGEMDGNSDKLYFGALAEYNGKFYFDNFEFFIQNKNGKFEKAVINNGDFEIPTNDPAIIPGWMDGIRSTSAVKTKEFKTSLTSESAHGNRALLIEGEGIKEDRSWIIGPIEGFSPQMGTLITMLNNLSNRVESAVQLLNQEETDYLLDEKANSIGALVMHLAAAEAYYQVYTFENREFNDEEKKKWQVALDLDDGGRMELKGKDIEYYLNIYKEVRKKTIEELKKRDDQWLAKEIPGRDINNHFCWFHVMEHQSSHLGQILLLKKRLPKRKEKTETKIDHNH